MRSCPSADSSVWARSCSRCLGPLSELTRTRNTLFRSDEIMIDIASGKVAYAVVSFGGFLGMGEKLFALPWSTLRVDEDQKHFIQIGRDHDRHRLRQGGLCGRVLRRIPRYGREAVRAALVHSQS